MDNNLSSHVSMEFVIWVSAKTKHCPLLYTIIIIIIN